MKVSAVISTKDRLPELGRCLETLAAQTRKPDELLIVDASGDRRVEALARERSDAAGVVLYRPYPSSLTEARNFGVKNTTGDVIVFLDDDLILEPDFIREIVRPLEADGTRALAGVTGDILNHHRDGEPLKRIFKLAFQLPCDGDGRFRLSGAPTMAHGLAQERQVEFVPGGLTAWRREVFDEFQFDESLPGLSVNEDVDFSYRVSRRWRCLYAPRARVTHARPPRGREATLAYLRLELASAWYLYRKNLPKDPLRAAAFAWSLAGVLLRFAFRRWLRPE